MQHVLTSAIVSFSALFPVVNPIGTAAAFVGLSADMEAQERRRQAARGSVLGGLLLVVFFVGGSSILSVFGVSFAAVEAVGGLVIGFTGWQMLHGIQVDQSAHSVGPDIAFYPLAFPFTAGPGALALCLGLANRNDSSLDYFGWAIGIVGIALVSYVLMRLAIPMTSRLGDEGIKVIGRVFGVLVLAIGAEMVFHGVAAEFGLELTD